MFHMTQIFLQLNQTHHFTHEKSYTHKGDYNQCYVIPNAICNMSYVSKKNVKQMFILLVNASCVHDHCSFSCSY
jgi:hypothetical protein